MQNEATRSAIENIVLQLGKIENYNTSTAGIYYNLERNINGSNQNYMTWNGKIALMYSSDYGFATSGGKIKSRSDCLNKELYNWGNSEYTECFQNDFLHISTSSQWSINAYALNDVFAYAIDGMVALVETAFKRCIVFVHLFS